MKQRNTNNTYKILLSEQLNKNTYNKILYENNNWKKPIYKQEFDKYLKEFVPKNALIIKIYKKVKSIECDK